MNQIDATNLLIKIHNYFHEKTNSIELDKLGHYYDTSAKFSNKGNIELLDHINLTYRLNLSSLTDKEVEIVSEFCNENNIEFKLIILEHEIDKSIFKQIII